MSRVQKKSVFLATLSDVATKIPMVLMEYPIFSLSKNKDIAKFEWRSMDGELTMTVTPTNYGRANIYDLDTLIFISSQVIEARNNQITTSKKIRFHANRVLLMAKNGNGGYEIASFHNSLRRLKSTLIETNIEVPGCSVSGGFSLLESYIVTRCRATNRMKYVEITLSDWLYRAMLSKNIKVLPLAYFNISSAIDRRLYLVAHKHLGNQKKWQIWEKKLYRKHGGRSSIYKFRYLLNTKEPILDLVFERNSHGMVTVRRKQ